MALSGIQLFKQLPKTNCKDCGYPTCMAFALQVAAGKAAIAGCPHLAGEVLATLSAVTAKPIVRVEFGPAGNAVVLGEETVLYRHEKRFEHVPALAILLDDRLGDEEFSAALDSFNALEFERVGEMLRPQLIAVSSADAGRLTARAAAASRDTKSGVIIVSDDPGALRAAGEKIKSARPLLCGASAETFDDVRQVAADLGTAFVVSGGNMQELGNFGQRAVDGGVSQMIFEPQVTTAADALAAQVYLRRAAIRDKKKEFGFPTCAFACGVAAEPMLQTMIASALIAKYAGIVVVDTLDPAHILALLTLAQGLYTDPQKPMMVDAGVYPVGNPGANSPVLLTTNFSLTYYTVMGEIENSKIPAWLLVMDVEGQSVLTAWAAGKFVADAIAPFVKKSGIEENVDHRRLIIPGYVASMGPELESELDGWQVVAGVREAADLPRYLRNLAHPKA